MSQQPSPSRPLDRRPHRSRRLLEIAGAAAIAATYVFLVLTQPADIANGPASFSALVALGGFLLGAVLLIVAAFRSCPPPPWS